MFFENTIDHQQILQNQLNNLYETYSITKNIKLQKLKTDIEKASDQLDRVDPKNASISDRLRLSQCWINLQRKLDEQLIDLIYKPRSPETNQKCLGDIHLKTLNQDNEYLQRQKLDNQYNLIPFRHSSTVKCQFLFCFLNKNSI